MSVIEPIIVYHEVMKRELNRGPIYECRCDERLKVKDEGSTRLTYTGLHGGMEHLKTEPRLIDDRFASVMGECEFLDCRGTPSIFNVIRSTEGLVRMFPTFDRRCKKNAT